MAINNKKPPIQNDRKYWIFALKIVGDFGASIAIPVVIFVIIGQWIDRRFDFSPWATVFAFLLSAVVSGKMIYQKAKKYGNEYQNLGEEDSKK